MDFFVEIVRCDGIENYMFHTDSQLPRNCIPYRCKVEEPDALQHNGIQILKQKCSCGSKEFCYEYMEDVSLEDGKSTTLIRGLLKIRAPRKS